MQMRSWLQAGTACAAQLEIFAIRATFQGGFVDKAESILFSFECMQLRKGAERGDLFGPKVGHGSSVLPEQPVYLFWACTAVQY
jgi:hypothetical protein